MRPSDSAAFMGQPFIAKLDRLARNVAFISNLMESGVDFVAVDFPQANRLTVHILAAVAEHEREMIASRTKAALAAAAASLRAADPRATGRQSLLRQQHPQPSPAISFSSTARPAIGCSFPTAASSL
jgi:DNA invertase Pin-like site-specific DNA recombinase